MLLGFCVGGLSAGALYRASPADPHTFTLVPAVLAASPQFPFWLPAIGTA